MRNLLYFVCLTTAINLLMVPSAHSDWLVECGPCRCKWISGKKTADCKNTVVTRVPNGLSTELQVLDMSNNYVPEIQSNEFATANLRNLHKLFIRNATLKQVNRDSLKGLEILIELDLSYNLLRTLPRSVFNNLVKLRALMLNNNKLERLDDGLFRNLKFLHKIELKENVLARIETKAFTNLPVLTQIYLDGNQLTVLRRECFQHLEKLTSLSLKQNPWNCTCELKPFRDFAFEQNLYTPPTDCHYPETLRGTLWTDVSIDAFACRPKIVYPVVDDTDNGVAIVHANSDNVTMACRMEASPSTTVTWTYNKHALATHPKRIVIKSTSETNGGRGGEDAKDVLTSELTIVGVRKTDEGTYTCSAQNVGGHMEIDIQLQIGRGTNDFFLTNQMMFVLCVVAVGLLMVSIVIMIVTCCYCRKFKNLIKHDLDEHNGATSIGMDTANGSTKKHFQSIKLNSFNNATLIGNGSIIVGNTMVTTTTTGGSSGSGGRGEIVNNNTDASSLAAIVSAQTNGSITIAGDCEKQKSTSNEFIHANMIKSDMSVVDTHETNNKSIGPMTDKILVVASENRLQYPLSASPPNGAMASPTATRFSGEHQLLNQMQHHQSLQLQQHQQHQQQRHQLASNARLPPDLLPYGQHQSLALKNSLNNSSSSGSSGCSSGGSTVIIDHRTQTYSSSSSKYDAYAASYDDDINDAMKIRSDDDIGIDDVDSDSGRLLYSSERHLIRRPSDEPDLRIYHHDIVGGIIASSSGGNSMRSSSSPKPFSLLGSSCTTTMTIASGKTTTLLPSHRFKNYELSSSAAAVTSMPAAVTATAPTAIGSNKHNNYSFYSNGTTACSTLVMASSKQAAAPMQTSPKSTASESIGNASAANCKPRQSIVRTSPSFSFLSTGYHQQQDNFL